MIKHTIFSIFGIAFFLLSCDKANKTTQQDIVKNYFSALNTSDFPQITKFTNSQVKTLEMGQILTKNADELYTQFQWDSVFSPTYRIVELTKNEDTVSVTVSKTCKRIRFLQDSAMVYKSNFVFKDDKISSVNNIDYVFLDFEKWPARLDALNRYIDANHSGLSGFANELTLTGAQNYLKAIELYRMDN